MRRNGPPGPPILGGAACQQRGRPRVKPITSPRTFSPQNWGAGGAVIQGVDPVPETPTIRLSPSILAADFASLGEQIAAAEEAGADAIHFDVMDGIFVPNISIGLPILEAVRRVTSLPIDVHLMIDRPERYLDDFVRAGANWITVHVEEGTHLHRTLTRIRSLGAHPGVTLNPATPAALLSEVLPIVDLVLVMSVNPG